MEEEEAYDNLNPKLTSNKRPKRLTKLETIRNFLRSEKFHTIVVILVVIDCLCVTVELTLEHIENYVLKHDQKQHDHHRLNFYFHLAEGILQYTCLTILALFVVEVLIKLAFIPRVFISSKWEILDALVVVISFGINIYLLNNKHVVMSIGGLLTLLRLWRITEIVNAVIVTIQLKHKAEKEQFEEIIKGLKYENEYLRNELIKQNSSRLSKYE